MIRPLQTSFVPGHICHSSQERAIPASHALRSVHAKDTSNGINLQGQVYVRTDSCRR